MAPKRRPKGGQQHRQSATQAQTAARPPKEPPSPTFSTEARPSRTESRPSRPAPVNRSTRSAPPLPAKKSLLESWSWKRPEAIAATVIAIIVAIVLVLLVIGYARTGHITLFNPFSATAAAANGASATSDQIIFQQSDEGRTHVPEGSAISYRNNPPSSGPHYPSPQPWGIYTKAIVPGYWVHNLEHGGIVVLYNCPKGCPKILDELTNAYRTYPKDQFGEVKLVITPYANLPTQVAAIAWDWVDEFKTFDPTGLRQFYNTHVDHGPEQVP